MTSSPTPTEAAALVAAPVVASPGTEPTGVTAMPFAATVPTTPLAPPPLPIAPERYDLALEGFSIDPALVQNADPVLRDIGLSNEAANKLLPVAREIMAKTQESLVRQIEDAAAVQKQAWYAAFVSDPQIGGARQGETEHFAAKALATLGYGEGHPFRQVLNESGIGNHPDMLRTFRRLGELVGEDGGLIRPTTASSRTQPIWERLYPNDGR